MQILTNGERFLDATIMEARGIRTRALRYGPIDEEVRPRSNSSWWGYFHAQDRVSLIAHSNRQCALSIEVLDVDFAPLARASARGDAFLREVGLVRNGIHFVRVHNAEDEATRVRFSVWVSRPEVRSESRFARWIEFWIASQPASPDPPRLVDTRHA